MLVKILSGYCWGYIENKIADRTEKYKQQMRDSFERDV
jgi:hypothetical protein